jgi:hypothetical protein
MTGHDILLDGHNHLEICEELKIPYTIKEIPLKTHEDALNWIIDLALGQQNLTKMQRSYLRGKRYKTEKKRVGRPGPKVTEAGDKKSAQNAHLKLLKELPKKPA